MDPGNTPRPLGFSRHVSTSGGDSTGGDNITIPPAAPTIATTDLSSLTPQLTAHNTTNNHYNNDAVDLHHDTESLLGGSSRIRICDSPKDLSSGDALAGSVALSPTVCTISHQQQQQQQQQQPTSLPSPLSSIIQSSGAQQQQSQHHSQGSAGRVSPPLTGAMLPPPPPPVSVSVPPMPPVVVAVPPPPPPPPTTTTTAAVVANSAAATLSWHVQFATQTMMRVFAASRSLKVSPLWSLLGSVLLAYLTFSLFPASPPNILINILVIVLFFLVGLSLPLREWIATTVGSSSSSSGMHHYGSSNNNNHYAGASSSSGSSSSSSSSSHHHGRAPASSTIAPSAAVAVAHVCAAQFLVAPAVTAFVFWIFHSALRGGGGGGIGGTGGTGDPSKPSSGSRSGVIISTVAVARFLACGAAAALPPSPSSAASIAASVSPASETLAYLVSSVLSTAGLFILPFVSQLVFSLQMSQQFPQQSGDAQRELGVHFRESTELLTTLLVLSVLPLAAGAAIQMVAYHFASSSNNSAHATSSSSSSSSSSQQQQSEQTTTTVISGSSAIGSSGASSSQQQSVKSFFDAIASLSVPDEHDQYMQHQQQQYYTSSSSSSSGGGTLICADIQLYGDNTNNNNNYNNNTNNSGSLADPTTIELCRGHISVSRARIRKLVGMTSFALRFLCFVLLFRTERLSRSSSSSSLTSVSELVLTLACGLVVAVINAVCSWFVASKLATQQISYCSNSNNAMSQHHQHSTTTSPDFAERLVNTRIALFVSSTSKGDLIIAPLFSQLFVVASSSSSSTNNNNNNNNNMTMAPIVALMAHAFVFCFAHLVVSTLSAIWLRGWRRRSLCSTPGVTLLPQKLTRLPAHHAMLAPPMMMLPSLSSSLHSATGGSVVGSLLLPGSAGGVTGTGFGLSPLVKMISKNTLLRQKSEANKA